MEKKPLLEELLNELSLQLIMSDEGGIFGNGSIAELLLSLQRHSKLSTVFQPLASEVDTVQLKISSLPPSEAKAILEAFISKANAFLHTPTMKFAEDQGTSIASTEVRGDIDSELLIEFIEKHTGALDEFEAALLDPNAPEGRGEQLQRYIKGYVHNLKGDAGSLGLIGIEKAAHYVEELILEKGVEVLLAPLIMFKEWVTECMNAFSINENPQISSTAFKERFAAAASSMRAPEATAGNDLKDEDLEGANLELLAELLAGGPDETASSDEPVYALSGDRDVFVDFINEADEHLSIIESTLLESQGNFDKDSVDAIFRGIHSIKGASSYFKLLEVADSSHHTESLLDQVRSGKRTFNQGLVDLIFSYVDLQRNLLKRAKEAFEGSGMIERLEQTAQYMKQLSNYEKGVEKSSSAEVAQTDPLPLTMGAVQESQIEKETKNEKLEIKNYIKVETDRLDQLIDSIGEMSVYSSMLIQACRDRFGDDTRLMNISHQVEKFGRELQQVGMSMRLIPIRGLFQKMSRLVWDTARKIGKEVQFQMEGEDTELDRTIIEKLADPLMHMVRNAIDHGIETPEERERAGKSPVGQVYLSAYHSGGNIHIQIKDDGKGLNPEKLVKKAIEKGILSEGAKLSDKEAFSLIFAPGFSTAAQVTDISGRGVGMDVVRRNIETMRGRVHINSILGQGTVFTIELPLTLAIIDGIQVSVGDEYFIVPTLSVVEFMKPQPQMITRTLDRGETLHFRGKYLPVYRLSSLFNIHSKCQNTVDAVFVIVENHGQLFSLMVDEIIATHSTVIKSIGDMFPQKRGIAGCAIMPNGDVALILDLSSVLSTAREGYVHRHDDELRKQMKEIIQGGETIQ